jgi:hypothetical protein
MCLSVSERAAQHGQIDGEQPASARYDRPTADAAGASLHRGGVTIPARVILKDASMSVN